MEPRRAIDKMKKAPVIQTNAEASPTFPLYTAGLRVDWVKRGNLYFVSIVPHIDSDNLTPTRVWAGESSDETFEIIKLCQEKINAGWSAKDIKGFVEAKEGN